MFVLYSQSQKIIYNVKKFIKTKDKEISKRKLQEWIAQACSLSRSNVYRIIKEASVYMDDIQSFTTLHKNHLTKEIKTDLDDFT